MLCFGTCRKFEYVFVDVVSNVFSVMSLGKVISIEKMEDTSLLPNPIIISIRSKTAFQFIELKDRDTLVENLLQRFKEVNSSNTWHCNNLQNNNQVLSYYFINNLISIIPLSCLLWEAPKLTLSQCLSDATFKDLAGEIEDTHSIVVIDMLGRAGTGRGSWVALHRDLHSLGEWADRDLTKFNKSKCETWQNKPMW